jgi:ABC-type transport system involved in cytochrome bd biosynthesis fused ATPase/permease subunit
MSALTKGEKWIRMLRGYAPVAENKAQQAEHVDDHSAKFDVPPIRFDHPAKPLVLESFPLDSGCFKNTVLTGTAGDGKTSLCFELIWDLAQRKPNKDEGVWTLCR